MIKKKILLLGSSGLLGSSLSLIMINAGYKIYEHGNKRKRQYNIDLTDKINTDRFLNEIYPDIIINLVGLTDVEACELNPNNAYKKNVKVVENIVEWVEVKNSNCYLIHISTDQVYDGTGLHIEDNVRLTNYYSFSKYAGELIAKRVKSVILRTNFFGKSKCKNRKSLTDWLYDSSLKGNLIQVFDDVFFNPISMNTLSKIILLIIKKELRGTYNIGSLKGITKADFAFNFFKLLSIKTSHISRVSIEDVSFIKAYRPKDMRMNCSKIHKKLNIKIPDLEDELKQVAEEYYE